MNLKYYSKIWTSFWWNIRWIQHGMLNQLVFHWFLTLAHTISRSVERQWHQTKDIVRLVDIGVLEENYSSEWVSSIPTFTIIKTSGTMREVTDFRKLNLLLKHGMSSISYSKDWGHDPFNGRVFLCFSIELKYGISSHQTTLMRKI
jgi:hypothetical protein